jgi:hypothetical protein
MILFRTHHMPPEHWRYAAALAGCGERLAILADERAGSFETSPWPKVSLTVPACEALGLYCTDDVGWRCGDYGFYLARQQFPDETAFWIIEPDVRIGGSGPAGLFGKFREDSATDLIVADLRPADHTYFWEFTIAAPGLHVHRCLFPLVRLSARAVDLLLSRRVALSRNTWRRRQWPNDEVFVATILASTPGMICRDLNDFGETLWTPDTLSYWQPLDGDALPQTSGPPTVYHPVLFGDAYRAKLLERAAGAQVDRRLRRRIKRRLIREVNRRAAWG